MFFGFIDSVHFEAPLAVVIAILPVNFSYTQDAHTLLTPSELGTMETQASFEIDSWDEEQFSPVDGADKLTQVSVVKVYSGGIEGEGQLRYLMRYHADGSAEFSGLERIVGSVDGKSGSFIIRHTGQFEAGQVTQSTTVLLDSGTGELEGIRGGINQKVGHQQTYPITFRYSIE